MHDDFGIGEEVPVGGVIEVQMTQYHQIHIFGCDTELRQRVDDGSTLVVTGSVEKQPPPTCGGYKVTTAPARKPRLLFPGKPLSSISMWGMRISSLSVVAGHPPATVVVLLWVGLFSAAVNPYSRAGFSVRMRRRISASGAHTASRSSNSASFGMDPLTAGCGQSLPQTMRDASASINVRAKGATSW